MDEIAIKMVLQEKQARKGGMNNSLGYQQFRHKYFLKRQHDENE